jgi:hypothetical protein
MPRTVATVAPVALVLSLALSAAAHNLDRQKRTPTPTLLKRGPPYPTGTGYDVVPLASIVPLSPGELRRLPLVSRLS